MFGYHFSYFLGGLVSWDYSFDFVCLENCWFMFWMGMEDVFWDWNIAGKVFLEVSCKYASIRSRRKDKSMPKSQTLKDFGRVRSSESHFATNSSISLLNKLRHHCEQRQEGLFLFYWSNDGLFGFIWEISREFKLPPHNLNAKTLKCPPEI